MNGRLIGILEALEQLSPTRECQGRPRVDLEAARERLLGPMAHRESPKIIVRADRD